MNRSKIELAEKQAAMCRAVSNRRRLIILWMLSKEELSVNEIAERVKSSPQNVSQHLSLLKNTGLVSSRRAGQTIFYQIVDQEYLKNCPALQQEPESRERNCL